MNPLGPFCDKAADLLHHHIDGGQQAVAQVFRHIVYLLLQPLEFLRLRFVDRVGHVCGHAHPVPHRAVQGNDAVLEVAGLVIQKVDQRDSLGIAEGFLQLHLFRRVHRIPELAAQQLQYLRHGEQLIVGVGERKAQRLAALGGRPQEGFVFCPRLAAAHGRLQRPENSQLFLQRYLGRRCRRPQRFDRLRHAGAGGLKGPDAFGDPRREHLSELHIRKVAVEVLIDAISGGEQVGHLADSGFCCFGGNARQRRVLCDPLIRKRGDAAFYIVGCCDKVRLGRPGPLVGKTPGGILQRIQVLDTEGGKLPQRPACFKGGLHRGQHRAGDLPADRRHSHAGLCHAAEGLLHLLQLADGTPGCCRDPRHRFGEVIHHIHDKAQPEHRFKAHAASLLSCSGTTDLLTPPRKRPRRPAG